MNHSIVTPLAIVMLLASHVHAEPPSNHPFKIVVIDNDSIIATLPERSKWLVTFNSKDPRPSKKLESFTLRAEDQLILSERHSSYSIKPVFSPKPGLEVTETSDMRSFGGTLIRRSYIILAKPA